MKNSMKFLTFFTLVLGLTFMACKGEDGAMGAIGLTGEQGIQGEQGIPGDTGPAGEDGRDGNDGANGTNGEDGEDGEDGNANVFTSDWIDIVWSPAMGEFGSFEFAAPEITQEDLDGSVLLGYLNSGTFYYNCPHSWNGGVIGVVNMAYSLGQVTMYFQADDASFSPPAGARARYVIIPSAGRLAANSDDPKQAILDELEAAEVDINNYEEVLKYLEVN